MYVDGKEVGTFADLRAIPGSAMPVNPNRERDAWNRNAGLKRATKKAAKRALKAMGLPNQNKRKG